MAIRKDNDVYTIYEAHSRSKSVLLIAELSSSRKRQHCELESSKEDECARKTPTGTASDRLRERIDRVSETMKELEDLHADTCNFCHSHPFPVPPCTRNPPIHPRKSYSTLRTHVFSTLLF